MLIKFKNFFSVSIQKKQYDVYVVITQIVYTTALEGKPIHLCLLTSSYESAYKFIGSSPC